jgi:uncharacterized membrane-anchored protein
MKKILLYITIIYFLILLAVPCYTIYDQYDILSTGETYKIEVNTFDPYDPFRGRYVAINPLFRELRNAESIELVKNDEDFVVGVYKSNDTNAAGYVKNISITRYYMNENTAPLVEDFQRRPIAADDVVYVAIKVKDGKYVIEGLYINDIAAEDYFY